ncbi:hypothetical protein L5515_013729 [Caenorhabditis briggsae]|uniref:Uncharacterized protein n=1 Tax=Caenorhabditis briggsae TaxID=6238 RepID=A0AAE9E922_CAEBR|nr:hypothetical protein L5515_013729 [Caenorhabditis briggsae]
MKLSGNRSAPGSYRSGAYRGFRPTSYEDEITASRLETGCPGCCIGPPGKPGLPVLAGKPGMPGTTPNQTCPLNQVCYPPPCLKGPPRTKRWPGFKGDVDQNHVDHQEILKFRSSITC